MIRGLVQGALRQRIVVAALAVVALAFGIHGARKLSVDAFPDVTNVQVQVATEVPGRSPDEVERLVTIPVEITMTGLPGLVEMRSHNQAGLSIVTLVFSDDTPLYFARQVVAERLDEVRSRVPPEVMPIMGPVSTALSEVYHYTIEHPDDGERPLTKEQLVERRVVQDWIVRPLLRSIGGIAEINSIGGWVKQYQVLVDPLKMRHYGLTIQDVAQALSRNNANSSGGILPQGPEFFLVRSVGLIQSLDDIRSIVLKEVGTTPVRISDVAEVRLGEEVRYGAMIKGGYTESVGGVILMVANGNAKEVVQRVKARVEEINAKNMLPGGLRIVPYYDRSELVDAALNTVSRVLIEGIILVIVVLFLYLGDIRSSLIVIATLILTPGLTFVVMNAAGMSANLMSLGGLAIAIGLIVDGSVVVVENVFARLGGAAARDRTRVVFEAVMEVATPVVFGICIIILVFLPLMTLEGMEGKMFAPLAYTIAIALGISLILSLTLSPVLSSYLLKASPGEHETWFVRMLKRPYTAILSRALRSQTATIVIALALFAGALALFPYLGTSFIPELKEGTISPNVDRVANISLEESIRMEIEAINMVKTIPGISHIVSRLGRGESPIDPTGYAESDFVIQLKPLAERKDWSQERIAQEVRRRLAQLPGITLVMAQPISDRVDEMVTGVRADIAVKIFGEDLRLLLARAEDVARVARRVRGTGDVKIDKVTGQQNINIEIDRAAIARHGLNAADVNDVVEAAIAGKAATEIYEGERRFQAVVRYPEKYRNNLAAISSIILRAPDGEQLPLSSLARIEQREGYSLIKRESAKRRVVVAINVEDRDLGGYVEELQRTVTREVPLPAGYYYEWGGQFENMERARRHLMIIVPVTIGAIFFLLFVLFNSLRFATLIISVLPFASIGGIVALYLSGEYLSVPASVGFIALWGIAVLNGVVLVSYIRNLRMSGIPQQQAVVEGAKQRFRPVMMTATVAALGLVPFLFATGPGSEVQRPLAIVVIGGLISSTLLTLVVVPVLYRIFEGRDKSSPPDASSKNLATAEVH